MIVERRNEGMREMAEVRLGFAIACRRWHRRERNTRPSGMLSRLYRPPPFITIRASIRPTEKHCLIYRRVSHSPVDVIYTYTPLAHSPRFGREIIINRWRDFTDRYFPFCLEFCVWRIRENVCISVLCYVKVFCEKCSILT